ncbi:MAG: tRNA (adenosine(37)-N6)-threonylcarbamoyltransferase complex transferase subunit TsaD, partial [Candidatus Sumerlaeaceae bacterium]
MIILGIETSCDETSVALVRDGRDVLVNHVASQVKLHERFGGVVPELASRAHLQLLAPMIEDVLDSAGLALGDVDAIAVTQGPGLIGALLVGVETAKSLAFCVGKPLIPVHHIAAHLYAPLLCNVGQRTKNIVVYGSAERVESTEAEATEHVALGSKEPLHYPFLGLVVSGGHTSLILVHDPQHFELLGETRDDAAGEAFDKVAKLLDLGYPGGPVVDKWAREGDRQRFALPRPMLDV